MPNFVRGHEAVIVFVLCVCVGLFTWHLERWRDRRAFEASTRHVWQCVQFHGGGNIYTPRPMSKADACEWAGRLGDIAYVDETHHKIFYRARSGR